MAKVKLILGAGGARGMAHIGVIEALEKDGHEIVELVGCSMGAVVGGMYCSGILEDYKKWLLSLNRSSVVKLMDFTLSNRGFLKGERVFSQIFNMCGDQSIEDFSIPFTAVSMNILNYKEVHFTQGDLYQALRASISIPGIFTPLERDGALYVDGGVVNPLPVNLVEREGDALIVAVNINHLPEQNWAERKAKLKNEKAEESKWPFNLNPFGKGGNGLQVSLLDLLQHSYDATQNKLTELYLQQHPVDILVEIDRNSCGMFEFHRAEEMIELGAEAYAKAKTASD